MISNVVRRYSSKSMDQDNDYIAFGPIARGKLNNQAQYARHWLRDPEVNEGIRWRGDFSNYHTLEIHKDDVDDLVKRVKEKEKERGIR
jgi:hypothetical protein